MVLTELLETSLSVGIVVLVLFVLTVVSGGKFRGICQKASWLFLAVRQLKLTLWVSVVYVLSFICYVPTLLEQNGIIIPNGLLYLKYLYVCIPAIATIFLLICEQNIKVYFTRMFSGKITISLGMEQIVCLCIWTLLVSVVLGITYYQCRNILLIAIMHATFNICYLAPIQYNIVVLAIIIFVGALLYKKSGKKFLA